MSIKQPRLVNSSLCRTIVSESKAYFMLQISPFSGALERMQTFTDDR